MTNFAIFLIAFAASGVEMVEAATIVLAMAITRGARSAMMGVALALVALAGTVAVFIPVLGLIPLSPLRLIVGCAGLVFGGNWLRKAVLRSAGRKAKHDEDETFRHEINLGTSAAVLTSTIDRLGFVVSAKAVLLEGLEVIVIVLTIGAQHGNVPFAIFGALVALITVCIAAWNLRAPLARVPENTLKLGVGIMVMSFGTFWIVEGTGIDWPGGDTALIGIAAGYAAVTAVVIRFLRSKADHETGTI